MRISSLKVSAALLALGLTISPLLAQDPPAPKPLDLLVQTLGRIDNADAQANILRGMNTSLKGRHGVTPPAGWDALYEKLKTSANEEVRNQAKALSVTFGGAEAMTEMRKMLADANVDLKSRQTALDSLLAVKDKETLPLLLEFVKQPGPLRDAALRGLASYEDPQIGGAILAVYKTLDTAEKRDALNTLLARPASAREFLSAIDAQTLTKAEITAPTARQLQDLHDPEVDKWMSKNWGAVRTSPADKQAQIAKLKTFLSTDSILHADANRGRAIFTQTCAICHTLFGYGAKIGPELPGFFEDIDYLLLNIVDPDAIIGKDYQQILIHTKDGQTVSGIIASDDANAVSLKSLAGVVTVQRSDITSMEVSPHSLMPEGLITSMDEESVRDLFLYLRQHGQVPMLATPANAADFFSGSDLARWHTSPGSDWKVENGEIVGHGGAKKATSLGSDMLAGDYKLTAMVKVTGSNPVVELAYAGRTDGKRFVGKSVGFGGKAGATFWMYGKDGKAVAGQSKMGIVPAGEWTKLEITSTPAGFRLSIGGMLMSYGDRKEMQLPRSQFAFYALGADTELRVKDLKLEVPEAK